MRSCFIVAVQLQHWQPHLQHHRAVGQGPGLVEDIPGKDKDTGQLEGILVEHRHLWDTVHPVVEDSQPLDWIGTEDTPAIKRHHSASETCKIVLEVYFTKLIIMLLNCGYI